MSSRMIRYFVAAGLFPVAVLVLHYVLRETLLKSFMIPLAGVGAALAVRLSTRRDNTSGGQKHL